MSVKCKTFAVCPNRQTFKLYRNTGYNTANDKKNDKLKENLWKVSYYKHCNFLNRNVYYSVNFVPDLNNISESEHSLVHIMEIFLNLNLMKIPF